MARTPRKPPTKPRPAPRPQPQPKPADPPPESAWPAAKVEMRATEGLVPYAQNARTHSDEQVEQIAASIREWGWTVPVLIDEDDGLIAGHGRVLAAKLLGIGAVPAMVARGWTANQKRAYVIADNKLAENAGWDGKLLKIELGELQGAGFNIGLVGFSTIELKGLFANPSGGRTDPDESPDIPKHPIVRLGDLWQLGEHRIICGDSTDKETVARLLGNVHPHLMVTDPPYGVKYDAAWRDRDIKQTFDAKRATGKVANDEQPDWREAWALFPGEVAYVWCASLHIHEAADSLLAAGFQLRSSIIWAKQHFIIGRGDYHWQHEPCWYAVRKGGKGHWNGDRKQSTVWEIKAQIGWESAREGNNDKATGHGTQKPVECMRRPIENNSKPGDAVYEPFSGSGSTIIAAEITGRICYAVELNPAYVEVAVRRWMAFTGQQATRAGDGRPFSEVEKERGTTTRDQSGTRGGGGEERSRAA